MNMEILQLDMQKKAVKAVYRQLVGLGGSGLAWMVERFSECLLEETVRKVKDPFDDARSTKYLDHLFTVIKANLFVGNYKKRITENIKLSKALPKSKVLKKFFIQGKQQ